MDRDDKGLVLLLAVVVCVNCCLISEASVEGTVPAVRAWTREDVRLPCHFIDEEPLAVFWIKEGISIKTTETIKASFFDGYFVSEEERFNIDEKFSLAITDLHVADEGRYYCQLMLENFEVLLNSTNLTVNFPVVDTISTIQGWTGEDIRLPCDFQEEPLAVYWVKESMSHPELSTSKAFYDGDFVSMEERFDIDENFNLFISDLAVADEGLYHCQLLLKTFENFSNSTLLTVNSMASNHAIEECANKTHPNPSHCTYQTPSSSPTVNFTCIVSGFKPNVTMLWTDQESGERLDSVVSQQTTLLDGTYERFETITVLAKHGAEQNFMCAATGDSLNGNATVEITVLPLPGKRVNLGLIIGLAIGVPCILLVVLLVLARRFLRKDNERDKLRRKIRSYVPGMAYNNIWLRDTTVPSKVNITFFGETGAGKSCLINSLNYALTGKYSTIADEGYAEHSGGKTHHILTDRIDLIDTCGITDFSSNTLERLKDKIKGKFRVTDTTSVQRKDEECHYAVFVYHYRPERRGDALSFIAKFCLMVRRESSYRTDAIIVVTHKNGYDNERSVRFDIYRFIDDYLYRNYNDYYYYYHHHYYHHVWSDNILMFENYTRADNEEDVEKDIKYLQFLWRALEKCDEMLY